MNIIISAASAAAGGCFAVLVTRWYVVRRLKQLRATVADIRTCALADRDRMTAALTEAQAAVVANDVPALLAALKKAANANGSAD